MLQMAVILQFAESKHKKLHGMYDILPKAGVRPASRDVLILQRKNEKSLQV